MADYKQKTEVGSLESEVQHVKLGNGSSQAESKTSVGLGTPGSRRSKIILSAESESPSAPCKLKSGKSSPSKSGPASESLDHVMDGGINAKCESGPTELSRAAKREVTSKSVPLFLEYEDKTEEATRPFQVITGCIYANKYIGSTEHALECDCAEEWDSQSKTNGACGEDSDCINRATKMECIGDCTCGASCLNRRFQLKQYAAVSVIKTEKKGYGLRADAALRPNQFIFEYVGEVIGEAAFRRRTRQYDEEGIKHFYFMSLTSGEFVDATKKGNLGRFCNHSCNPNCYVDKWVVGDKLRMGIFAERDVMPGEELVFNYNVDRYGADPQPCYCGEHNCTGFIGGKTQTERATKLSHDTLEALGIDDDDDWDTAVAKRPRKPKKTGEDDEDYVDRVQPRSLEEDGVSKVMAKLMQCKEKWIAVKLLNRIHQSNDERVWNRVVKMHGYRILKTSMSTFADDVNIVLQIFEILFSLPRITRNKIQDSKIEETVETMKQNEDERVVQKATEILEIWRKLEIGYRIPRMKRDPSAAVPIERTDRIERRESARARSKSRSPSRSRSIEAPRGPAASASRPGRPPRPFRRPAYVPLPAGWFSATTATGQTYYYSANRQTTWERPTVPASQAPPPPPPKAIMHRQALDMIIQGIAKDAAQKKLESAASTPQKTAIESSQPREKKDKWRSLPEEKQKRIYENTLYPHIKHVVDKFKSKLPKEDLKRLAKEVSKKLVNSDYKNNRVADPTQIPKKQERAVKKFVAEFLNKAYAKKKLHDRNRSERKAKGLQAAENATDTPTLSNSPGMGAEQHADNALMDTSLISDDEKITGSSPASSPGSPGAKRKRGSPTSSLEGPLENQSPSSPKKLKVEETPPPPPPPPPPPADLESTFEGAFPNHEQLEFIQAAQKSALGMAESVQQGSQEPPMVPWQLATPPTNSSSEKEAVTALENGDCEGVTHTYTKSSLGKQDEME